MGDFVWARFPCSKIERRDRERKRAREKARESEREREIFPLA